MIDVNSIPLIDNHCHPFLPEKEHDQPFSKFFTISFVPEVKARDIENTVIYRRMIKELQRVLEATNEGMAIARRMELYRANKKDYIDRLFSDANIDTLILDIGYPSEEFSSYSVQRETFTDLIPRNVRWIFRIEPLIQKLFTKNLMFKDFLDEYLQSLDYAVKKDGYCAIKTVMAYIYGLKMEGPDERSAEKIYEEMRGNGELLLPVDKKPSEVIKKEKILREFLAMEAIRTSIKLNVPMQIHTGIGASPHIDVRDATPLNLISIITNPEYKKAKLVLVHSGYPFVEESGYLVNQYPNVYTDLSEMNPFIGAGVRTKILSLLEMAPTTKIMYGSDGFNIPEVFWLASIICREALGQALDELVGRGFIDEDYANRASKLILRENAKKLYKV